MKRNIAIGLVLYSPIMKFTNLKLGSIALLAICLAGSIPAAAQSIRHNRMDAKAARADIRRLKVIRRRCVKYKNWGKLMQTDRLIAEDKKFIHRDSHKIHNAGG
ncbi:MAG: hypothetical protein P4L46_20640 [Fimbriimonas sp.]|nr:hypothetical protein [Fimbriimonas sp.]